MHLIRRLFSNLIPSVYLKFAKGRLFQRQQLPVHPSIKLVNSSYVVILNSSLKARSLKITIFVPQERCGTSVFLRKSKKAQRFTMRTRERPKARMERAGNCEFCRFALYAKKFALLFGTKSLHLRNSLNFDRLNLLIPPLKLISYSIKLVILASIDFYLKPKRTTFFYENLYFIRVILKMWKHACGI